MPFPCTVATCTKVFDKKSAQISHSKACEVHMVLEEDRKRWAEQTESPPPSSHIEVDRPVLPWENISPAPQARPPQSRKPSATTGASRKTSSRASSSRQPSLGPRAHGRRTDSAATVRIDHHSKRKRPSEYITIEEYNSRRHRPGTSAGAEIPLESLTSRPPHFPFQTDVDYRFAKLVFRSAMKDDDVKELLSLINQCVDGKDSLTFNGCQAIHDAWKDATSLITPFECTKIDVPHGDVPHEYDVWVRSVWEWLLEMVGSQKLAREFVWESVKMFKKKDDGDWERFVTEPWTGDDWAEIESNLPDDGVPLCLTIYADKTQLSSFGGKKGYPVYAKIANLPAHVRNGKGIGGGCCVGWLPVIPEASTSSKKSTEWAEYKRVVWHESFRAILESIKAHSKEGVYYKCGDGIVRRLFPCILILSADYEEQAVMAGLRGSKTKRCPVCLVNEADLATFFDNWEYRDSQTARKLIKVLEKPEVPDELKDTARKNLVDLNIRPIKNVFSEIANSDPHRALSFDRLHNYPGGLAKTHLLELLYKSFKTGPYATPEVKEKVNSRANAMPRWPGLSHFSNITHKTAFQDSNKWEDIARIFPFILYDDVIAKDDIATRQLLRCLRVFLNLNAYSSFETHTESTVAKLEEELSVFCDEIEKLGDGFEEKSWLFPKMHLQMHLPRDLFNKGVTRNYTTKIFEVMHRAFKFYYQFMSNFKDVESQILSADDTSRAIDFIDSIIEVHQEALKEAEHLQDEEPQQRYSFGNVTLKAPQGPRKAQPLRSFQFDSEEELGEHASTLDGIDIKQALKEFCSGNDIAIAVDGSTLIRSFRSMEAFYTSKESWDIERDLLRCSPSFHNRPRYDCVIIQTTTGPIFARLLSLFTLQQPGSPDTEAIPFALALPYATTIPAPIRKKDTSAGFYRVRKAPRPRAEFFFARSIVRGAVLVAVNERNIDFLVFDVTDSDMFLRVQELLHLCAR
ncbi:hypothetical protein CC1G_15464 [Coprinopsis cinerea okayama7|uniref:C2H2-type domain-containing protein n=1 Tax=Coprinopsis cinerea (strain Okayama-7 / 130 / ATCC MYA-4618 / FGSC 9003) TaxID=240176 RepID=D6RQQ6_COPC7|nr:hypothetical protein CC1G_15464 [Coprinopsis cinerea okayama7\|eukprot:XP_002910187.1 hypothetical protein CC1G_15464 [Coprinopsis cinerea okayama7\